DDQHVPAAYVRVQVLQNAHHAGGLSPRAVGGDGHPVHLDGQVHGASEVCHHHHRPLQHADKEQFTTGVIGVDLRRQLSGPPAELLGCNEHLFQRRPHVSGVHSPTPPRTYSGQLLTVPLTVPARSNKTVPDRLAARTPPGRSTPRCPCQSVT